MLVAETGRAYAVMYSEFVRVMVYGTNSPSFVDALTSFRQVLKSSLPPPTLNYKQHEAADVLVP